MKTFVVICRGVGILLSTRGPKHYFTEAQWIQVRRILVEDALGRYLLAKPVQSPNWGRHKNDKQPS